MAITFTDDNFKSSVLECDKPVLVDFWAVWCGPCKMLGPTIDAIANEYEGKAVIGKVNVDENQQIASEYGIMSIPTVIIFNQGKIVEQFVGVQPKNAFTSALDKYI